MGASILFYKWNELEFRTQNGLNLKKRGCVFMEEKGDARIL